jgi:hypothetical protein
MAAFVMLESLAVASPLRTSPRTPVRPVVPGALLEHGLFTRYPFYNNELERLSSTNLGSNGLLQQLRGWKPTLLDQGVKLVRQVHLHPRHAPNYTPSDDASNPDVQLRANEPPTMQARTGIAAIIEARCG